jgi:hypothetical protein
MLKRSNSKSNPFKINGIKEEENDYSDSERDASPNYKDILDRNKKLNNKRVVINDPKDEEPPIEEPTPRKRRFNFSKKTVGGDKAVAKEPVSTIPAVKETPKKTGGLGFNLLSLINDTAQGLGQEKTNEKDSPNIDGKNDDMDISIKKESTDFDFFNNNLKKGMGKYFGNIKGSKKKLNKSQLDRSRHFSINGTEKKRTITIGSEFDLTTILVNQINSVPEKKKEEEEVVENKKHDENLKNKKNFSKYSDLVLGDRMSEKEKQKLGIIHKCKNNAMDDGFTKKVKEFGLVFAEKKEKFAEFSLNGPYVKKKEKKKDVNDRDARSSSIIKFIPAGDKNDINKLMKDYVHMDESKKYCYPIETNKVGTSFNTEVVRIEKNMHSDKLQPPSVKARLSLSFLVKKQFEALTLSDLKEPVKKTEACQDNFIRNKNNYVKDFQNLNRHIEKENMKDTDKKARCLHEDIMNQESWQTYTTLLFYNLYDKNESK